MSTNCKGHLIALLYLIAFTVAKGQNTNKVSATDGIWQDYGPAMPAKIFSEFSGRLVNVNWSDVETSPGYWDWSAFDNDITQHISDNMPVILLVYTGPNAPDWLYSNGVPKVNATDSSGNILAYSPYYLDSDYNYYFKRMIVNVRQHIQSYPSSVRNLIIGIQGCYGSTGDPISYKGLVPDKYQISTSQFDSLFKVYSLFYYNQYQNVNPPISLLSNPSTADSTETYWLLNNCPGGWLKCGSFSKRTQINTESDKSWLYNVLNQPQNGQFVMSRSEITGPQLSAGWWQKNHYKEMFGIMCYCIYWGLDWPNETPAIIADPNYDSAFAFFNKYAGQKIPGLATNAVCALKDVLDASDSIRFPASEYGAVSQTNTSRFTNIYNAYSSYGAKLEDVSAASSLALTCLTANGTNDVGWHLLPGNYERYLHQVNANATSAGYWNIDQADSTVMYGRYGRGFDIANKKNMLLFDVDNDFLGNAPLNGAYPVTIDVTYFDSGYGRWALIYNAVNVKNKLAGRVVNCTNTNTWKKYSVVIQDANFGNGAFRSSDFFIFNLGNQNVIFSVVELTRDQPDDVGFMTTALGAFDTTCTNSDPPPNSFVIHAASLDGSDVQVGPLPGVSFSTSVSGNFSDSLILNNYSNNTLNQTIYVKINTSDPITISDNIPITGGGKKTVLESVNATVVNTSPILNAAVSTVSCYNNRDGAINLKPMGGAGPFGYQWTNDIQQFWKDSDQDLSNLQPANYTVVVNSSYGCVTSKTFAITQPQSLVTSVTQDSDIVCKGGATTVTVSATGGTGPYTGTGSFLQSWGFTSYTVTDANGCSDPQGLVVGSGYLSAPPKPDGIDGPNQVNSNQLAVSFQVENPDFTTLYFWTVPPDATIILGQGTPVIVVNWGSSNGQVTVGASNICGSSNSCFMTVRIPNNLTSESGTSVSDATAKTLSSNNSNNEIVLMPNPVKDIATLRFFATRTDSYTIEVNDINGGKLLTRKGISLPGTNLEKFDVANLSAGMYLITLIDASGGRRTLKMIKQQ
jgi:hypothetical protein